jgi:hypothetical protein
MLMHGDQQSLWPDCKSHGSRSNFRKLFADKPAEVAWIEQKIFVAMRRIHMLFTTVSWCSLLPFFLGVNYSNRHIPRINCFNSSNNIKKHLNR